MDSEYSLQDAIRCDLCENAVAQSYCEFCHVNLCRPCIGEHISDEYDDHKIVLIQQKNSTLIYPKCVIHPQKICKFQCRDCNCSLCSSCIVLQQHKGHEFIELSEVYKTKKEDIKKDTVELKNSIFPSYEKLAFNLEYKIANLDKEYDKPTTEMSKLGEEWHKEIDCVIKKMKTEIGDKKMKHRQILQRQLNETRGKRSLILQTLQTLEEVGGSNDVRTTIAYNSRNKEFTIRPFRDQVSVPIFIPKPIDQEKVYSCFGGITSISLSATSRENLLPIYQQISLGSLRELLDEPELVATIQTGYEMFELRSVVCLNEERIWINGETNTIKCLSINGCILETIETRSGNFPPDIAVDRAGFLMYSDWKTKSVNIIKNGQGEELIKLLGWTPIQLCVTSSGDLLVSMFNDDETESKLVRFSGSTAIQTIQFDDEEKPIYSGNNVIKHISENRNLDVCVADCEGHAVVVVNQDGKRRFRYTGHPSLTKRNPFRPQGISTDIQSHILTADTKNHCIQIIDQNGQFLRYIDNCDLDDPWGLCVYNNDYVLVCESKTGVVKKIRYLKDKFNLS